MAKDWVGGSASVFKTLGASNHTDAERLMRLARGDARLAKALSKWEKIPVNN